MNEHINEQVDVNGHDTIHETKPFHDTWKLYIMHLCFAFVSRMWNMGLALLLAEITDNSLFVMATAGLVSSTVVFLGASPIGELLDRTDRLTSLSTALITKFTAVTIGYGTCGILLYLKNNYKYENVESVPNDHYGVVMYIIPLVNACAHLSFNMVHLAVEKDWVVTLSNGDSQWLSKANSIMSQIDMFCNALAPFVTGLLFTLYSPETVAIILLCCNALVSLAFYLFVRLLYYSWSLLRVRQRTRSSSSSSSCSMDYRAQVSPSPCFTEEDLTNAQFGTHVNSVHEGVEDGFTSLEERTPLLQTQIQSAVPSAALTSTRQRQRTYIQLLCCCWADFLTHSGCIGVMVAYSCLFVTVLSYGSLMIVYLKWTGMSTHWIGLLSGAAALFGLAGAAGYPHLHRKLGLWNTAQCAIVVQSVLVSAAALSMYAYNGVSLSAALFSKKEKLIELDAQDQDHDGTVLAAFIMAFLVMFSRAALWCFDLAARQIAQERIPEHYRGRVNAQWKSIVGMFDMASFSIAMVYADPCQFIVLVTVSAIFVFIAMMTFTYTYLTSEHDVRTSNGESRRSGSSNFMKNYGAVGTQSNNQSSDDSNVLHSETEINGSNLNNNKNALFARKDKPGQSMGSVLGSRDRNPAVVPTTEIKI